MKIFLKIIFSFFFVCIVFSLSAYFFWYKTKFKLAEQSFSSSIRKNFEEYAELKTRAALIKNYAVANHFNSLVCFMVNMSISSGKNRFFVYDLQKDSVLLSGLVAHGSCDNGFQMKASFSNKINCGCTCLGKFKVGKSYNGKFGLAYKLYGLDPSNSNAYKRNIVLHSYRCVPEQETQPLPICNSRGCPMVSPGFLNQLNSIINKSNNPILLWIYK